MSATTASADLLLAMAALPRGLRNVVSSAELAAKATTVAIVCASDAPDVPVSATIWLAKPWMSATCAALQVTPAGRGDGQVMDVDGLPSDWRSRAAAAAKAAEGLE